MKLFYVFIYVCICSLITLSQKPDDLLATATGHTIRLRDLSAEIQKNVADFPARLPKTRAGLLEQMISEQLLKLEAASRGISSGKLIAVEKAKLPQPTEAEIKNFLAINQRKLVGKTLDEMRKPIGDYLRGEAEQNLLGEMFKRLKTKYKFVAGKSVNAVGLGPNDAVATLNGRSIAAKEFEDFARIPIYNDRADVADAVLDGTQEALYNKLLADEAKALGIDAGVLIGREVTDKMKDFSDEERQMLVDALAKRLFAKYQAKILFTAPEPLVQNISAGNSPSIGPTNAPVTIVMFSDFQCSACAATHPILKKAIEAYPGKIRFVVRNFPLESIHENAWSAALAGMAANAQEKFFEYIEVLYARQDAQDDASLKKYAAESGLNVKQFELDFNSEKTAAAVRKDMADGESYGIGGTPAIYVNGRNVRSLSAESFKSAIDKALGIK